MYYLHLSQKLL